MKSNLADRSLEASVFQDMSHHTKLEESVREKSQIPSPKLSELTNLFLNAPLLNFGETLLQVDKSFGAP